MKQSTAKQTIHASPPLPPGFTAGSTSGAGVNRFTLAELLEDGGHLLVTMALREMPYAEYLQTEHWQRIRESAIRRAGRRCTICQLTCRLEVHHLTYERRGDELPSDVIALCWPCHRMWHETWAHRSHAELEAAQ